MRKDTHKTKVIFRKFRSGGDIIAIFPELPGTNKWWLDCSSYMHMGQHGACSVDISGATKAVHRYEYEPLMKELEGLGYNLEIVRRFSPSHLTARKAAVEKVG